jgi:membrane peptidoglycan carboxypeptidase
VVAGFLMLGDGDGGGERRLVRDRLAVSPTVVRPNMLVNAAGMEGATDEYVSAWYAGYTPGLASAVTLGGRRHEDVDTTSTPGTIWKETMTAALTGLPGTSFTEPGLRRFGGCRESCDVR